MSTERYPFAFDACPKIDPRLGATRYGDEEPHRSVACLLHDPALWPTDLPTELGARTRLPLTPIR